jgi:hypothetical protein
MTNQQRLFRLVVAIACATATYSSFAQTIAPKPPSNVRINQPCSAPANTPGGSDGMGGCFPGPGLVGPPEGTVLTAYTGPCAITTPNTVIDSKIVNCDISVRAGGLVIKNSIINGSVLQPSGQYPSFSIEYSKIDGADGNGYACVNCGVTGQNFTLRYSEIVNTNRGVWCQKNCIIEDNYIHGTTLEPVASNLAHASAARVEQYTTIRHNVLSCDFDGPFPNNELGCSAGMTGYPDFAPIHHNTIEGNLFVANRTNGFCAYGGATQGKPYSNDPLNATYIVFRDNVWQRGSTRKCGAYGPITSFNASGTGNVWSNNRWDDGTLVPPAN